MSFFKFEYLWKTLILSVYIYIIFWASDAIGSFIGGFIASIPVALPLALLLNDEQIPGYSLALLLGRVAYIAAALALVYFFNFLGINRVLSIIFSMLIWFIIGGLLFIYYLRYPPDFIE